MKRDTLDYLVTNIGTTSRALESRTNGPRLPVELTLKFPISHARATGYKKLNTYLQVGAQCEACEWSLITHKVVV